MTGAFCNKVHCEHKRKAVKRMLHHSFRFAHMGYFGSLVMEGHGIHAQIGGVLLAFLLVDLIVHFEESV